MKAGDVFMVPFRLFDGEDCTVTCIYSSAQILRFLVINDQRKLELQKILIPAMRQPWRILSAGFEINNDNCGRRLNQLFWYLDDAIKPKSKYDRSAKD